MSHQYDKLGSSGESSQGVGGSGVVVNGEERGPELEPLLAEPSQDRHKHHHHHHHYYFHHRNHYDRHHRYHDHHDNYYRSNYATDNDYKYYHHKYHHHDNYYHHHHHHHRQPSYYQHQNTYAPRSSIRYLKDLQDVVSDSRVGSLESLTHTGDRIHSQPLHPRLHSRSPSLRRHSPLHRSPSPSRRPRYDHHQPQYHDVGFSDTVTNVVEIQRHIHHPHSQYNHRHKRDYYDHYDYYDDGPWSASTSPARSPSPVHRMDHGRHYGTTSLEQRSRSPSPASRRQPIHPHHHHHPHQHSYPVLVTRRGQGRRLPPTPNKPSTLQLKPSNINFPKLNASPTHGPHLMGHHPAQVPVHHMGNIPPAGPPQCPLSFEQAVAMGRGGRLLPSPVPNGFKPPSAGLSSSKQRIPRSRHSDSDEDDWC